jgi:hypothetical protein
VVTALGQLTHPALQPHSNRQTPRRLPPCAAQLVPQEAKHVASYIRQAHAGSRGTARACLHARAC